MKVHRVDGVRTLRADGENKLLLPAELSRKAISLARIFRVPAP
jgi:hypothetical protein